MDGDLLTTTQVADRLGVSIKTVWRYLHQGKLKGVRIGRDYRIPEGSLKDLLILPSAGRPTREGGALIHALRHTFASVKAQRGISAFQLKEWLGHANLNTTQIYVHMSGRGARKAMGATSL